MIERVTSIASPRSASGMMKMIFRLHDHRSGNWQSILDFGPMSGWAVLARKLSRSGRRKRNRLLGQVETKVVDCFRNGGGVPYSEYPEFHGLMRELSGVTFDATLIAVTLPLVEGLTESLAMAQLPEEGKMAEKLDAVGKPRNWDKACLGGVFAAYRAEPGSCGQSGRTRGAYTAALRTIGLVAGCVR